MIIIIEVEYGWAFKLFHSNNASLIFLLLYLHIYKNIMIVRYRLSSVWYSGLIIMIMIIGAGFSGYVLVGAQISLWAAMVITSLIRVFPFNGEYLIYLVWGGYSVSWVTLQLLFLVHFLLPFLTLVIMIIHLVFLHDSGRTRIIFSHSGVLKIRFYPYYWIKDILNLWVYLFFVFFYVFFSLYIGRGRIVWRVKLSNKSSSYCSRVVFYLSLRNFTEYPI